MATNRNTLGIYTESFLGNSNSFSYGYPIKESSKRNTFEPYPLYPFANTYNVKSRIFNPNKLTSELAEQPKEFSTLLGQKYAGENHFPGYNYLGPGTRTEYRIGPTNIARKGEEPINKLDQAAFWHDVEYKRISEGYSLDSDAKNQRTKYMNEVHKADKRFMSDAFNSGVQPLGAISAGLIGTKMLAEKTGVLSSKRFSGIK